MMYNVCIYVLAISPLSSSGFAPIFCYRASAYDGVYIMKNYAKLNAGKSAKPDFKFFLFFWETWSQIQIFFAFAFPWLRQS